MINVREFPLFSNEGRAAVVVHANSAYVPHLSSVSSWQATERIKQLSYLDIVRRELTTVSDAEGNR